MPSIEACADAAALHCSHALTNGGDDACCMLNTVGLSGLLSALNEVVAKFKCNVDQVGIGGMGCPCLLLYTDGACGLPLLCHDDI